MELSEEDIVQVMVEVTEKFLIPRWDDFGLTASGEWIESLEQTASNNTGFIRGRDYSQYLHRGRGPNKDQDPVKIRKWAYWYGMNVIKPWADAKGIVLDSPIGVAHNIATKGTSWARQGGTKFLEVLESPECLDYIRSRFTTLLTVKAQAQMQKFLVDTF